MRHQITIISLIAVLITTTVPISLVSEASIHPSKETPDWTVHQPTATGTPYYADGNHPQAQDGSDPGGTKEQKTFQVFLPLVSKVDLSVFPGAEGFGTDTPAGRGGQVIRVTTLADSGPGSLRAALNASGPRTIIFEVGGIIWLKSDLTITNPYLTVAGQTAPSPGITLANAALRISTHDVLVQHLYVRPGDRVGTDPNAGDGIQISRKSSNRKVYNVVIDHCSISWAIDKNLATWQDCTDITVSHCIVSESLHWPDKEHRMGFLIYEHAKRVAVIGNLFAHNSRRNPAAKGDTSSVIVNNLTYNAGGKAIHFFNTNRQGKVLTSVVGNVILPGPNTGPPTYPTSDGKRISIYDYITADSRFYLRDNAAPLGPRVDALASVIVGWRPIWIEGLTVLPAKQVKEWVLANAGARPWDRDAVDERIVNDVRNGTGQFLDSQGDVGGWPSTEPSYRTLDLPDRPNDDDDGDGYTNLEEWLFAFGPTPPTPTPSPTATSTPLPTDTPTLAPTNTPMPTATNTPLPTYTPTFAPPDTPTPTNTLLPTNTPTSTPTSTPMPTPTDMPSSTPTLIPDTTATATPTNTPHPTATSTPLPTDTPVPTNTPLLTDTPTLSPTSTPTPTPTETLLPP
jgi:hypothetical protein